MASKHFSRRDGLGPEVIAVKQISMTLLLRVIWDIATYSLTHASFATILFENRSYIDGFCPP
jgi:membrane associated rhomboid family serine protease